MLELYHNTMSSCAQNVRVGLAKKGLAWERHHLDWRAGDQQQQRARGRHAGQGGVALGVALQQRLQPLEGGARDHEAAPGADQ